MKELIQKLQENHGLSADDSYSILNTIKDFVKERFPMVGGAIDNIFPANPAGFATSADTTQTTTNLPVHDGGDFMDKISDFLPGATGGKV
jgi:hypothetical protein